MTEPKRNEAWRGTHAAHGYPGCPRCLGEIAKLREALAAFVKAYEHIGHGCWPVDKNNPHEILSAARAALAASEVKKAEEKE